MPTLSVTISDFTGDFASNNGAKSIALTQEKVLHAAFTVGTPLLKKGTPGADHALAMAAYKGIAMMATMDFSRAALSCFPEYKKLDPSEKNNLSYWIGMVITALSAREFLKVDQLLHAACFHLSSITLTDIESKSLADLVGHDGDTHWHVLEAKGRQNKPSDLDRTKWKAQAQTIRLIGEQAPKTRSYCVAKIARTYQAELVDPKGENGTYDIEFPRGGGDEALINAYYGPLRDVLRESRLEVRRGNLTFLLVRVAFNFVTQRHVFAGMESNSFDSIKRGEIPKSIGLAPSNISPSPQGDDFYLGSDGIVILTSSKCDPQE